MPRSRVQTWDELPLDKVTEMVSRKVMGGERIVLTQVHLKRGAHVPLHAHDHDQVIYVLQGGLMCTVGGRRLEVRAGDVLSIRAGTRHQAVAVDDAFQLVICAAPIPPVPTPPSESSGPSPSSRPGAPRTSSGGDPSST